MPTGYFLFAATMVISFIINDSPIGKIKPLKLWHGTWSVTIYTIIILVFIEIGIVDQTLIPYFFLDVAHNPIRVTIAAVIVVYSIAYCMSWLLSEMNRKISWFWFKGFAK